MAFRWSSESIVAEYKELQANAMALDQNGQFALLAGRRNVAIIDLDKPTEVLKRMTRAQQKYNVTVAEWNPHSVLQNLFVLAAGERAELLSWYDGNLSSEATLKAHTRTITDLNWHRTEPTLLATCSIDTFLHVWDTRETRKPALSLSAIAGASQVKWNKLNSEYLASGHDCDIRIWDRRKANQPFCYINAHLSKIHGLDWSPNHETQIVSSSNDSTVKFFDITNPRKREIFINTQSPVWRARYTPFGEGLITVVVPPLRRGENSLLLWSMVDTSNPVHTFVGHCDVVLEFDWRCRNNLSGSEFQLVTWARDNSLRIWKIDPQLLKICGHSFDEEGIPAEDTNESSDAETLLGYDNSDKKLIAKDVVSEQEFIENGQTIKPAVSILPPSSAFLTFSANGSSLSESEKRAPPKTLSICESPREVLSQSPDTPGPRSLSQTPGVPELVANANILSNYALQQEFSSLSSSFDENQNLEILPDAEKRLCQVTVKHGNFVVALIITFPLKYPNGSCPSFRFSNGTNIDQTTKAELLKVLKSTALQYTSIKKKKGCMEPCIRILVSQLKALLTEERTAVLEMPQLHVNNSYFLQMYGGQQDYSIPFPRTSGGRFCSSGYLVCFTRPTVWRQGGARERSTPRSLSALGAHASSFYPQLSSGSATSPKYNYLYPMVCQSPSGEQNVSISMYYYQDRKIKTKRGRSNDDNLHRSNCLVSVYDASRLMSISKDLASLYVLDEEDLIASCNKNKEAATQVGRKDLVQVWALTSASLSVNAKCVSGEDFPWAHHPFGRKMLLSLIDHYLARFDVQTAALLSCVLGEKNSKRRRKKNNNNNIDSWKNKSDSSSSSSTGGSPYNTIHGINTDGWGVSTAAVAIRHNRSNSEGSLPEASRPSTEQNSLAGDEDSKEVRATSLLDPGKSNQYNEIRTAYADILYRWDLLEQRAMVNKYTRQCPTQRSVEFHVKCPNCGQLGRDAQCHHCKMLPHRCSICRLPVRGSSNFCMVCGHGGHTHHYYDWFKSFDECPTGCGCECLVEMEALFA